MTVVNRKVAFLIDRMHRDLALGDRALADSFMTFMGERFSDNKLQPRAPFTVEWNRYGDGEFDFRIVGDLVPLPDCDPVGTWSKETIRVALNIWSVDRQTDAARDSHIPPPPAGAPPPTERNQGYREDWTWKNAYKDSDVKGGGDDGFGFEFASTEE